VLKTVEKLKVGIYIKSNFRGNPRGAGEAAAIVEFIDKTGGKHTRKKQIRIENDTKNALHLKISIAAMRLLVKPCNITIYIDCDYMANTCKLGWLEKWQRDDWKKANGKQPANVEDWKQFYMLIQIHTVVFAPYDNRHDEELERTLENEIHGK
jgi:ribonuclease HI